MSFSEGVASPSHSWLKNTFSSQDSPDEPWPDLLMDRRPLPERRLWRNVDPVVIERNNLVIISQLVMKRLVDCSLRSGRQLEDQSSTLHQFFILLEMIFKHGFRTGRRLMYSSKDLWDLLQQLDPLDPSAADIAASVRDLPKVKTNLGRARAWFRLALMQKKLPDYFKLLVDSRELLQDYFYPSALLCSEEAALVSGLLLSLNIVDFNLCVKDEDFDTQDNVIDLSMYLRRKEDIGRTDSQDVTEVPATDLQTIVDQKNYVEEVNRNLVANITNLQAKVERLTTTNMLMNEDLTISKRKLEETERENRLLQDQVDQAAQEASRQQRLEMEATVSCVEPTLESDFQQKLAQEHQKRIQVERELSLEVQMKAECEIAMKLMEKDVHEKQDTIRSLRSQLEDIKAINLEMYTKLAECKKTIEVKSDIIQKLETKSSALLDTMQELDDKFVESERSNAAARTRLAVLENTVKEKDEALSVAEQDVKIEREWRERLQETTMVDRDTISNMKQEIDFLKQVSNDYENIRQENLRLKEMNKESDKTLEELGQQLSWNKLQLDSYKEERVVVGGWEKDSAASSCKICDKEFNIARRKHHCRNCGGIFCDKCSDNKMELPASAKKMRVCDNCYVLLLDRQSKI